jgi:hypothetical protein
MRIMPGLCLPAPSWSCAVEGRSGGAAPLLFQILQALFTVFPLSIFWINAALRSCAVNECTASLLEASTYLNQTKGEKPERL